MMSYPLERLREEVAYLSYYFHWPYDQVVQLDHLERQLWVSEIVAMHQRMSGDR